MGGGFGVLRGVRPLWGFTKEMGRAGDLPFAVAATVAVGG